jgi:hypothetical protein
MHFILSTLATERSRGADAGVPAQLFFLCVWLADEAPKPRTIESQCVRIRSAPVTSTAPPSYGWLNNGPRMSAHSILAELKEDQHK